MKKIKKLNNHFLLFIIFIPIFILLYQNQVNCLRSEAARMSESYRFKLGKFDCKENWS